MAVESDGKIGKRVGARFFHWEKMDVRRRRESLGDNGLGIMISTDGDDGDFPRVEPGHLLIKKKRSGVVLLVAIVEVSGDDDECDFPLKGKVDEVGEGLSGGTADGLDGGVFMPGKTPEGTVEMEVGSMKEAEHSRPYFL